MTKELEFSVKGSVRYALEPANGGKQLLVLTFEGVSRAAIEQVKQAANRRRKKIYPYVTSGFVKNGKVYLVLREEHNVSVEWMVTLTMRRVEVTINRFAETPASAARPMRRRTRRGTKGFNNRMRDRRQTAKRQRQLKPQPTTN
jgi:hypothetical protein